MSDRLKYRVWDKSEESYFTQEDFTIYLEPDGRLQIIGTGIDGEDCFFETKDVVIEQCTGLKDKNGKLIYEGDIVELTRARNYGYIPRGSRLVIKWNTFDCCGFSIGIRGNLTQKCADNCIVVGNIHENADLLGKDK